MQSDKLAKARRDVLKSAGAATGSLAVTGIATAKQNDLVRVNIGYKDTEGRKFALDASKSVHQDFSFDALSVELPKQALDRLRSRSELRYVEEDRKMYALAESLPWGVDRIDAEQAQLSGYNGSGADIAILDTGIDPNHPDLYSSLGSGAYFTGTSWYDYNGHGTHCAGIAAGVNNSQGVVGVAPGATLHSVKVLSDSGSGYNSDIAGGIEYVADQGWDVGSMSLGGPYSSVVKDACTYAYNRGVFLPAATGNDGCYDCVGYPAANSECVAVGSTDSYDNLSSFSNTGPEVELVAPGSNIYSTYYNDTYTTMSGTSMATPHVAGAAGVLMGELGYSNVDARSTLNSTAEDLGMPSYQQGHGLLDAATAVGVNSGNN
ncbi:S8 family peptidase [Haladaptatus sp. SPP-AMP-3]|uniref:S8 family peptidase n=1 Tax=Haladaptatus sp. SPP-AMP-3 TaxID=3121295 RepID=UPI003C2B5BF9